MAKRIIAFNGPLGLDVNKLLEITAAGRKLEPGWKIREPMQTTTAVILSLGNQCYQVSGDHPSRSLNWNEDAVLSAFIGTPTMTTPVLAATSSNDRADEVLRRLAKRFPEFALAIGFPRKKGDGFTVCVRTP